MQTISFGYEKNKYGKYELFIYKKIIGNKWEMKLYNTNKKKVFQSLQFRFSQSVIESIFYYDMYYLFLLCKKYSGFCEIIKPKEIFESSIKPIYIEWPENAIYYKGYMRFAYAKYISMLFHNSCYIFIQKKRHKIFEIGKGMALNIIFKQKLEIIKTKYYTKKQRIAKQ